MRALILFAALLAVVPGLPARAVEDVAPEEVERVYREGFGRHAHLGADIHAIPWSSLFVMHQCTIPDYRHGRVFLADGFPATAEALRNYLLKKDLFPYTPR